jgi:hypothetical protein
VSHVPPALDADHQIALRVQRPSNRAKFHSAAPHLPPKLARSGIVVEQLRNRFAADHLALYRRALVLHVQVDGKSLCAIPYRLKSGDKGIVGLDGRCDGNIVGRSEAN